MDYKDLGMRVRLLRRQQGYTQEEFAEQVGISASFLGHIERGTRVASLETLVALCNTLNISPEFLLQASLEDAGYRLPQNLSNNERGQLGEFLHMAEGIVNGWDDE